jgi:ketosteroid isomerase-like protein
VADVLRPLILDDRAMTTATTDQDLVAEMQRGWDAIASGDRTVALGMMADDVVMENGPLPFAEPWLRVEGRDAITATLDGFDMLFGGTLRQHGRCIHADGRIAVTLVRDQGRLRNGEPYGTDVVAVARFDADGKIDRMWFIEIDVEEVARCFAPDGGA